jgi:hypothetical protein
MQNNLSGICHDVTPDLLPGTPATCVGSHSQFICLHTSQAGTQGGSAACIQAHHLTEPHL